MTLLLGKTQWTLIDLFTITWGMKVASALFSVNNSTSQWWKPSPWQNHSRKSIFNNNWIWEIIAARTEIAGSLSSAWGTGTSCSCLTFGTKENPNCDYMRLVRLFTLFSAVIFFLLEEGANTFNGNDSQRSETDFKIYSSMQRCLRECALVAEAVGLLKNGEGTISRIFTLSKHFDDLIFFTQ